MTYVETMSMPESRSIVPVENRCAASSGFTKRQRDAAFHQEVERYVAWARTLLDPTPDVIDSPTIRERRSEASLALLDVLWAVIAEYNALEGLPHPLPGLIAHLEPKRLGRASAS
jgi:hypothetical protein